MFVVASSWADVVQQFLDGPSQNAIEDFVAELFTFLGSLGHFFATIASFLPTVYSPICIVFCLIALAYLIIGRNA